MRLAPSVSCEAAAVVAVAVVVVVLCNSSESAVCGKSGVRVGK